MNSPNATISAREEATSAFDRLLTPDTLPALMRSTWTWDDRALRRDLAALLVDLDAAHAAAAADESATGLARARMLHMRAMSSAASFVAAVLGPKLIADTGNPLREVFVAAAIDPAAFDRAAAGAFSAVRDGAAAYVAAVTNDVDYPSPSTWMELVRTDAGTGLGAAMRSYGHSLGDSPFFGSVGLAWQTLRAVNHDSEAAVDYAEQIAAGTLSATLAAAEQTGSWDPALVRTRAVEASEGWQLTGEKQFVPAAATADVFFVIARSTAGPSLFAVARSATGLTLTPLDVVDSSRPLWRVEMHETPAVLLGREGMGGRLMMRAIDLAATALAGEQVGLIEKVMAMLASQVQGPRATADLTAAMAEVSLEHAAAIALWRGALVEDAAGSPAAAPAAAAAHIGCSASAVRAATAAATLLGPSADTDAVMRRAISGNLLFGGPALSHERLLERLGV